MAFEIRVPELSESVVEATVAEWVKKPGEMVEAGDVVVILETDKVSLEVAADGSGVLTQVLHEEGADVTAHELLGIIGEGEVVAPAPQPVPAAAPSPAETTPPPPVQVSTDQRATPVAKRVADAHSVDLSQVPVREGEKITKQAVEQFIAQQQAPKPAPSPAPAPAPKPAPAPADLRVTRQRMSRRRRTIAARLIEAQQTAAMLTTFNEIDMSAVMDVRARRKESFKKKHEVGLGFSSFFVKATIGALKAFPQINAEIDGDEIVLKHYYDIGIAIGAEEGLVVPVLRDADRMSFAEIERQIKDYAEQSRNGTLSIEALRGGTFTITNGGVFGSMMSTPILNPPQVGILGLHAITERAVVVNGEIVVRPMMYVALTYDHRIVDGREAVQFLVRVKDLIEDPETLLIEG